MKGLPGVQLQNKSNNSSYWRDFGIYQKEDVLFQQKIRDASEKFKNQQLHLLRQHLSIFVNICRNLSHETLTTILPIGHV